VSGIATVGFLTATDLQVSGIATVGFLTATDLQVSGIATVGFLTATDLRVSGIATVGFLTATDLRVSGVTTLGVTTVSQLSSAGNVTARSFSGSGINLVGIVTQITIGTGLTLTSSQLLGKGTVQVGIKTSIGKTIYVSFKGSDSNTGLVESDAKRTIKAAAALALPGDTIKVFPGTFVEDNPITLAKDVSIQGTELRNCIVTPQNPDKDVFYVNNGCHMTNLSFNGAPATNNSAVISLVPLSGVSSDRFFDAARMIRMNLDFIAKEAVGYLTSTSYKNPAFTVPNQYPNENNIKDIFLSICHDITRGGNSKCVGAGKSYYTAGGALQYITGISTGTDGLQTYSVKQATIDSIKYAVGIAFSCINNVSWTGNHQNQITQVKDLSMQADSATGSNTDIGSCANVLSAVNSCAGIVTTIINSGLSVLGVGINTTYPGNSGLGTSVENDPSFSPGVGVITKGPYIRNCTNFIQNSIGLKIDGFNAEPGDQIDNGIQGSMSVDSYTQYNQG
ncbi:MAG: hypothetical protein EBU90_29450, partial [Proteobacteria bacterium]|nr:hypothetical protein [Pseudomonadota bacterium]